MCDTGPGNLLEWFPGFFMGARYGMLQAAGAAGTIMGVG